MQFTYDTILSSIQNYCVDDSEELETEYPTIIQQAQDRVLKDLNITNFDASQNVTTSSALVTKPSDMIAVKSIFVVVNNERQFVQNRTRSYIDYYWQNAASVGTPKYYCDNSTTNWSVVPTPDASYTYKINYIARLAYLTSDAQTNWLSLKYGEVLFDAAMVLSKKFLREDPVTENGEIKSWETQYANDLALSKRELILSTQSTDYTLNPIVQIVGSGQ